MSSGGGCVARKPQSFASMPSVRKRLCENVQSRPFRPTPESPENQIGHERHQSQALSTPVPRLLDGKTSTSLTHGDVGLAGWHRARGKATVMRTVDQAAVGKVTVQLASGGGPTSSGAGFRRQLGDRHRLPPVLACISGLSTQSRMRSRTTHRGKVRWHLEGGWPFQVIWSVPSRVVTLT